eukprot:471170-Rhodomonas_salina.1
MDNERMGSKCPVRALNDDVARKIYTKMKEDLLHLWLKETGREVGFQSGHQAERALLFSLIGPAMHLCLGRQFRRETESAPGPEDSQTLQQDSLSMIKWKRSLSHLSWGTHVEFVTSLTEGLGRSIRGELERTRDGPARR